jgi:hypothetical protein
MNLIVVLLMIGASMVMFTCTSKAPERSKQEPQASSPSPIERHKTVNEGEQNFSGGSKAADDLNKDQRLQTEDVIRALGVYREQLESQVPNKPPPPKLPRGR